MMGITKHEVEREKRMVPVTLFFLLLFTFSTFTLIASANAQPPIPTPPLPPIFTDLNITPAEIEPGNEVTITFTITNSDNQSFTYTVTMQIGELNFLIDVELGAYESKTVSRTIPQYIPGDYNVTIDSLEGSFTVKFHEFPTPPLPPFLDNLNITPAEIERGENVTISFDIMNTDSQSITYGVTMNIENAAFPPPVWPSYDVTLRIWVDLDAYESKTVSRTLTLDMVGEYHVWVDGLTGIFTVGTWPPEPPLRPAELVLSGLSITPETAELWEGIDAWNFKITVNVTNLGEQEGMDTINLRVDGSIIDRRTVKLKGGEQATIMFDVMRGAGSYIVEVDGLAGGFTVKAPPKPAEFTVSDLVISLEEIEEGEGVAIHVNVMNIGEEEGSHTLEIEIDGVVTETVKVTLDGGESTTVTFMGGGAIGDHTVEIGELSGSFTVNPKPTFWDKIPGPPYESIMLGLVTTIFVLWMLSRRK